MLSREAVRKLTDLVDSAADSDLHLVDTEEVMKSWEIKGWYDYVVRSQVRSLAQYSLQIESRYLNSKYNPAQDTKLSLLSASK